MRKKIYTITTLVLTIMLSGCNEFGNRQNPLYGKVYGNIAEIPELSNFTHMQGSLIDEGNTDNVEYRFGISSFGTENDFIICVFDELLKPHEKGKANYKILDTINVGQIKETEYLSFCDCRQDTILDSEIIAIVLAEHHKEYYDQVTKAWRANTKTGKIEVIKNLKGINCYNDGYGVGWGDEENLEAENEHTELKTVPLDDSKETENSISLDSKDVSE